MLISSRRMNYIEGSGSLALCAASFAPSLRMLDENELMLQLSTVLSAQRWVENTTFRTVDLRLTF